MNVVRLMGGIGNQLFQYAFGRMFEERGVEVFYDLTWFKQYNGGPASTKFPRIYRMDKFKANIKLDDFRHYSLDFIKNRDSNIEGHNPYDERIFTLDNKDFEGYWQRFEFIKELLPKLQDELSLRDEVKTERFSQLADEIRNTESIAVHVRRGDYIGLWPILPGSYYADAINKLSGDLYIFSDDIAWCKTAFSKSGRKTTFVDLEDYLSFELMRLCKHKVTGNSTFSWWAAWLGGGTVFCPINWLGWKQNIDSDKRYPKEWIRIS